MSTSLLTNNSLFIDSKLKNEAISLVEEVADRKVVRFKIELDDGKSVEFSEQISDFVGKILHGVANGPVQVQLLPEELTTNVAADLLGISRPTLMKRVASGEIPSHKVGSHTRLKTRDVLAVRQENEIKRRAAFADLRSWDEEFS